MFNIFNVIKKARTSKRESAVSRVEKQKILKNVAKTLFSVLYMGQKASIIRSKGRINCQSEHSLKTQARKFTLTIPCPRENNSLCFREVFLCFYYG